MFLHFLIILHNPYHILFHSKDRRYYAEKARGAALKTENVVVSCIYPCFEMLTSFLCFLDSMAYEYPRSLPITIVYSVRFYIPV